MSKVTVFEPLVSATERIREESKRAVNQSAERGEFLTLGDLGGLDHEGITALRMELRAARQSDQTVGQQGALNRVERRIAEAEAELNFYDGLRQKLIGMSNDSRAAMALYSQNMVHWKDPETGKLKMADYGHGTMKIGSQKLRVYALALVRAGLLQAEQIEGLDYVYRNLAKEERIREAHKEAEALKAAREELITMAAGGDPVKRQEAMNVYNRLPESPMSWSKLEQFQTALVNNKMMPSEYRLGARFGNFISKFKRAK